MDVAASPSAEQPLSINLASSNSPYSNSSINLPNRSVSKSPVINSRIPRSASPRSVHTGHKTYISNGSISSQCQSPSPNHQHLEYRQPSKLPRLQRHTSDDHVDVIAASGNVGMPPNSEIPIPTAAFVHHSQSGWSSHSSGSHNSSSSPVISNAGLGAVKVKTPESIASSGSDRSQHSFHRDKQNSRIPIPISGRRSSMSLDHEPLSSRRWRSHERSMRRSRHRYLVPSDHSKNRINSAAFSSGTEQSHSERYPSIAESDKSVGSSILNYGQVVKQPEQAFYRSATATGGPLADHRSSDSVKTFDTSNGTVHSIAIYSLYDPASRSRQSTNTPAGSDRDRLQFPQPPVRLGFEEKNSDMRWSQLVIHSPDEGLRKSMIEMIGKEAPLALWSEKNLTSKPASESSEHSLPMPTNCYGSKGRFSLKANDSPNMSLGQRTDNIGWPNNLHMSRDKPILNTSYRNSQPLVVQKEAICFLLGFIFPPLWFLLIFGLLGIEAPPKQSGGLWIWHRILILGAGVLATLVTCACIGGLISGLVISQH